MDATPLATGRAAIVVGDVGTKYLLRLAAQKSEVDLAKQFLAKGGTLGGAAARGNTSFALSHADTHHTFLLTGTNQTIDLPLPAKLLETSRSTFFDETKGQMQIGDSVGPHVLLSDRARLNIVSTRTGAAINGTLVSTLSGTASVKVVRSLFHRGRQGGCARSHGHGAAPRRGRHPDPNPLPQLGIHQCNFSCVRAAADPRGRRRHGDGGVGAVLHADRADRTPRQGAARAQIRLRPRVADDQGRRVRA